MTVEVLERTYGHHHPDYLYRGCRRHHREETNKDCRCLMPDGGHSSEDISGLEIAKETKYLLRHWSEWQDSNLRPLRPERPSPAANHCIFSLFRRLPTTLFAFRSRYSSGGIRGVAFGSLSSARLVKNILNHYPTGSIWKSSGRKGADFQDTRLWAVCTQERIEGATLCEAIDRAERGLVDADLGGHVIKQRVARPGQGRSGGYRTLVAFQTATRAVFLHGFAKNERDNISDDELRMLRKAAGEVLGWSDKEVAKLLDAGKWTEVACDD